MLLGKSGKELKEWSVLGREYETKLCQFWGNRVVCTV